MNTTLDVKIQALTNTAATQVAAQLMEIMHQYMKVGTPSQQLGGGRKEPPLITQEGGIPQDRIIANSTAIRGTHFPAENNTHIQMLTALNEIEVPTSTPQCSLHDNKIEPGTGDK